MPAELATSVADAPAVPHLAEPRRWLSVVSHLDPKYGGLSAAVPQLAARVAAGGSVISSIEAFCLPGEQYQPIGFPGLPVAYRPVSRKAWLTDSTLRRSFRQSVAAADGLHIHGLWEQSSLVAARAARSLGKPYIVSAHGMLEPWALARGRTKKQLYAALFERANLAGAACLHALTQAEARNYRDFGVTAPIAVIPNGVEMPALLAPEPFLSSFPGLRGRRLMLFLGRLHQKKGVELLVRAWARVAAGHPEACLVIAGPSEDDTRASAEALVAARGLAAQVVFAGMLTSQLKWSALAAAEGFALTSYSEGLSVATLEAMGAGVPVLVTENCNLPEVAEQRAGWQVPAEEEAVAAALASWLENTPAANHVLGRRGAALVRERYSWDRVSAQMAELYAWVTGGPEPVNFPLLRAGRQA